jgi:hypothetical protein
VQNIMKLFVSYARIDKPFCIQLVDKLNIHELWYDQRLYAGQDWWQEILRRLEWCEGFIYLLSPDSVASQYCRQELEIAKKMGREIIPVLIHPDTSLSKQLSNLQYVDMARGLTIDNVTLLLNSILQGERRTHSAAKSAKSVKVETPSPVLQTAAIIGKAAKALESGLFDDAVMLLRQAKANGFQSRFIDIDTLLNEAEIALEEQSRRREAEREYQQIVELFQYSKTRPIACKAFCAFAEEFPDHDPEGLRHLCTDLKPHPPKQHERISESPISRLQQKPFLPLLLWKSIPAGDVLLDNMSHMSPGQTAMLVAVDSFLMSQFPVTNAQFDVFRDSPDGYQNEKWWQFSQLAADWRRLHTTPLDARFRGDERPRENINWYEAMAFCHWLSHLTDVEITLPTLEMWQRAALGDTDFSYPWGNHYHQDCCNTRESNVKMTTNVSRYADGVSPFGVYDMAGNVWEWCLDKHPPDEESPDFKRAVIGGSYVSPFDRAQSSFRYFLNPEARYSSIGFRLVALLPDNHRLPSAML